MKLLYVIRDSLGYDGGSEVRLVALARQMAARGHEVEIVCGRTYPHVPPQTSLAGIPVHTIRSLPEWAFHWERFAYFASRYLFYPATLRLRPHLQQFRPDLIIDYVSPSPSLVYPLARRLGIPIWAEIMEFRNWPEWHEAVGPGQAILGYLTQNHLFRAFKYDQIITISQFSASQLRRGGFPPEKVHVVPCGLHSDEFTLPAPPPRRNHQIIILGRLVKQKGHTYLLEALAQVRGHIPDVQLVIVGEGVLRPRLEQQVRDLGLEECVRFCGRVPHTEKVHLLWESSLFVMPSLQEGFGLTLLEAMACGLPVVAFDLPVFHELMDEPCGRFVPRLDSQALAQTIIELLQNEAERGRISAHNLAHVRQFSWENAAALLNQHLMLT